MGKYYTIMNCDDWGKFMFLFEKYSGFYIQQG